MGVHRMEKLLLTVYTEEHEEVNWAFIAGVFSLLLERAT